MEFKGTEGNWHSKGIYVWSGSGIFAADIDFPKQAICTIPISNNGKGRRNYDALLISKAPEMLAMLQRVIELKDLLQYPEGIPIENYGEAVAINQMISDIQSLIVSATELPNPSHHS